MVRSRPNLRWLLLLAALVGAAACEPAPKAYALVTLKHDETRIQMVAIMEIPGESQCDTAFQQFMTGFTGEEGSQEWRKTETSCQPTLGPLYQNVMNRGTFHATYMAFSPRNDWDYEGRVVLYGIPSSQAQRSANRSRRKWERAWTSRWSASRERSASSRPHFFPDDNPRVTISSSGCIAAACAWSSCCRARNA